MTRMHSSLTTIAIKTIETNNPHARPWPCQPCYNVAIGHHHVLLVRCFYPRENALWMVSGVGPGELMMRYSSMSCTVAVSAEARSKPPNRQIGAVSFLRTSLFDAEPARVINSLKKRCSLADFLFPQSTCEVRRVLRFARCSGVISLNRLGTIELHFDRPN
jgi:hypothetical protein